MNLQNEIDLITNILDYASGGKVLLKSSKYGAITNMKDLEELRDCFIKMQNIIMQKD